MIGVNSDKLQEVRVKAGMTQTELAKKAGCSHRSISAMEAGGRNPSPRLAKKIVHILKVEWGDIFFAVSKAAKKSL
jgi:DNA-binding XRE family transcriptional regulator